MNSGNAQVHRTGIMESLNIMDKLPPEPAQLISLVNELFCQPQFKHYM